MFANFKNASFEKYQYVEDENQTCRSITGKIFVLWPQQTLVSVILVSICRFISNTDLHTENNMYYIQ